MQRIADDQEHEPVTGMTLEEDERWQVIQRIAASASFSRSPRLGRLLLYVCEQTILDRRSMLTELNLASAVFERTDNFDPATDTIVRSQMLRLRQRLEAYFNEEGRVERIRVSIPKGGYVPLFEEVQELESSPTTAIHGYEIAAEPSAPAISPELDHSSRTTRILWASCIFLIGLSAYMGVLLARKGQATNLVKFQESSVRHQFWSEVFSPERKTTIVAADSGIVMLHGGTGKNTTLAEYLSRNFSSELSNVSTERQKELIFDAGRRYTSFVDLEFINRLTHLQEALGVECSIRFARDITVNDLKAGNIILSGSRDANPWLEIFEPQMNFSLDDNLIHGLRGFRNAKPKPGEPPVYSVVQDEYGVLALLPNLTGMGNVLIVEGTNVAGTQAVTDFLFMNGDMDAFLRKIAHPDGTIPPFEVLLSSHPLADSSSRSQIVSYRVH